MEHAAEKVYSVDVAARSALLSTRLQRLSGGMSRQVREVPPPTLSSRGLTSRIITYGAIYGTCPESRLAVPCHQQSRPDWTTTLANYRVRETPGRGMALADRAVLRPGHLVLCHLDDG